MWNPKTIVEDTRNLFKKFDKNKFYIKYPPMDAETAKALIKINHEA